MTRQEDAASRRHAAGAGRGRRRHQPGAVVRGRVRLLLPWRARAGRPPRGVRPDRVHGRREAGIGPDKQRGYGLAVALGVALPVIDQESAAGLVDAAHQVCPYSDATRDNIDVTIVLG